MRERGPLSRQLADASPWAARQLASYSGRLPVLGAFPTACYLQLPAGSVIALLSADAVALPNGLLLAAGSAELPLDLSCRGTEAGWLRDGELALGPLRVSVATIRDYRLPVVGRPSGELRGLWRAWQAEAMAAAGLRAGQLEAIFADPDRAVAGLLGYGGGLTPAGDDVLAGLLAGAVLFGVEAENLRTAVLARLAYRPRATTSLSGQLLRCAAAGDGIAESTTLARALVGTDRRALVAAWAALIRIGHSSGAAVGLGLLRMAERSCRDQESSRTRALAG